MHALLEVDATVCSPGTATKTTGVGSTGDVERAWALKRDWTDDEFQGGAKANSARLQEFEGVLVARLQRSCARVLGTDSAMLPETDGASGGDVLARILQPVCRSGGPDEHLKMAVLDDPEVLGSALDIVGAYLKNYAVDKAAGIVETVLPICRHKGGLWHLKALNHLATVRMKQARPSEALSALEEVDKYANMNLSPQQQDEAWEFRETVYRNFGWVLSSLGREDEAINYIQRAVTVKERVGRPASWFDLWDLGRMKAATALRRGQESSIRASQSVVIEALRLHQKAEPGDLVMRAKLWHSVGECSFALGHLSEARRCGTSGGPPLQANPNGRTALPQAQAHYQKALKCFRESHKLFLKTEGRHNPLTGGEAQAVAWALLKLGGDEEAKGFLLDVLEALSRQQSGWGDVDRLDLRAPALLQATQAVDRVLEAHRRTDDREGLARYFSAIDRLCANVRARLELSKERVDSEVYERLVSSCSMVMVASGRPDGAGRSQELLQRYLWDRPATAQAQLCNKMLRSLPESLGTSALGSNGHDGSPQAPGLAALVEALAKSCEVHPP
mmetsp:Transcript_96393/g.267781  ORF Transcript_96393/g.267781 Transcript_96393/m.267781 type:complete len:561 (-) Transcript_96393:41-1723(-)